MIKLIPAVFIFLLFGILVSAYTVNNLNTEIKIDYDGMADVKTTINFDSTNVMDYISLPLYDPIVIKVINGGTGLKYATIGNSILIRPTEKRKDYEIRVEYTTAALTSKEKDKWKIAYRLSSAELIAYDGLEKTGVVLTLPDSSILESFTNGAIMFTEGNKLKAGWKLNVYKNKDIDMMAVYSTDSSIQKNRERIKGTIMTIVLIILILAICCVVGYYCIDKFLKKVSKGKKDIIKTLNENEAKIVELLLQNKKQMYQSKIHKETGMSKATLSRVVKRLQSRNIVEVIAMGNTNMVALTKWFIKK